MQERAARKKMSFRREKKVLQRECNFSFSPVLFRLVSVFNPLIIPRVVADAFSKYRGSSKAEKAYRMLCSLTDPCLDTKIDPLSRKFQVSSLSEVATKTDLIII